MLNQIIYKVIKEATSDNGGGRGAYIPPMQPGLRPFSGESLQPFTQSVSKYKSPLVQYDSYDHDWSLRLNQIIELERQAAKIQDYIKHHPLPSFSEKEGYIENRFFPYCLATNGRQWEAFNIGCSFIRTESFAIS